MSTFLIVLLLFFYIVSLFGCIQPIVDRTDGPNLVSILVIFTPIVNTIYAFVYTDWNDIKKMFKK